MAWWEGSLKTCRMSAAESKAAAVRGGPGSWVAVCPSFGREAGGSGRRPGYALVSPLDSFGNQESPRCSTRSLFCRLPDPLIRHAVGAEETQPWSSYAYAQSSIVLTRLREERKLVTSLRPCKQMALRGQGSRDCHVSCLLKRWDPEVEAKVASS
jgi:hypothetical protein